MVPAARRSKTAAVSNIDKARTTTAALIAIEAELATCPPHADTLQAQAPPRAVSLPSFDLNLTTSCKMHTTRTLLKSDSSVVTALASFPGVCVRVCVCSLDTLAADEEMNSRCVCVCLCLCVCVCVCARTPSPLMKR